MAYIVKLQKGQPLSQEAAFSAVYHPSDLYNDPLYEKIYDGQKLGEDFFPSWGSSHKTVVQRISHKKGIMAGFVAQMDSALSPKDLRRLYGPGVYKLQVRGPMTDQNGVKKRYGKLAIYTVVIPFEQEYPNQSQTCGHCKYFSPSNDVCLKHKWMMTPEQVCNDWEAVMKKPPYIPAGAGLAGDVGLDSVSPVINNYSLGENQGNLSADMAKAAKAAKKPKATPAFESNDDLKFFIDSVNTQDVEAPLPTADKPVAKPKEPLEPPPDQYEFIRVLSQRSDSESED